MRLSFIGFGVFRDEGLGMEGESLGLFCGFRSLPRV